MDRIQSKEMNETAYMCYFKNKIKRYGEVLARNIYEEGEEPAAATRRAPKRTDIMFVEVLEKMWRKMDLSKLELPHSWFGEWAAKLAVELLRNYWI